MNWCYRVGFKHTDIEGVQEKIYGIVEAYYETDPLKVTMVSGFQEVWGSTFKDAEWCAKEMLFAFDRFGVEGILDLDSFQLVDKQHCLDSFEGLKDD